MSQNTIKTWQERITAAKEVDPKFNFDAVKAESIGAEIRELRARVAELEAELNKEITIDLLTGEVSTHTAVPKTSTEVAGTSTGAESACKNVSAGVPKGTHPAALTDEQRHDLFMQAFPMPEGLRASVYSDWQHDQMLRQDGWKAAWKSVEQHLMSGANNLPASGQGKDSNVSK